MATTTALSLLLLLLCFYGSSAQQQLYTGNDMLDCYTKSNTTTVRGYVCDDAGGAPSCLSYLLFRSAPPYDTPVDIAYLLAADAHNISSLNGLTDIEQLWTDRPIFVPVTCSCSGPFPNSSARYYQYNSSYTLKWENETYMIVSNNTYKGLTTCQAMMSQNPLHDSFNLSVGDTLKVPLRCACPTKNQTAAGYKYLLTYLVTSGDDITSIASRFRCDPAVLAETNGLTVKSTIFPYTTLLVPLKEKPTPDLIAVPAPPPLVSIPPTASPAPPTGSGGGGSGKGHKWVAAGIGIGIGILAVILCSAFFWTRWKRIRRPVGTYKPAAGSGHGGKGGKAADRSGNHSSSHESYGAAESSGYTSTYGSSMFNTGSTPSTNDVSEEARLLAAGALVSYKYWDLQKATSFFGETHRISGSVYKAVINGDTAAVKRMKGDVSGEVAILKRFNHSSLVRLSGFCVHSGNTYLVFEYAEGGSLSDRLRGADDGDHQSPPVTWKQRVQVAYDIADGLNYLHIYASPPCVHKDLRSSNVLLDGESRAKLSNFGLARSIPEDDDGGAPQMTRHVVGTQGYMPPEYLEHGLISPKMDIFALGVILLELLSGRDAVSEGGKDPDGGKKGSVSLLWEEIAPMIAAEDVRDRLSGFIDRTLQKDQYPFDAAFTMAQLARRCVARDPAARPSTEEVLKRLAALYSASLNWDPSLVESHGADSMVHPR